MTRRGDQLSRIQAAIRAVEKRCEPPRPSRRAPSPDGGLTRTPLETSRVGVQPTSVPRPALRPSPHRPRGGRRLVSAPAPRATPLHQARPVRQLPSIETPAARRSEEPAARLWCYFATIRASRRIRHERISLIVNYDLSAWSARFALARLPGSSRSGLPCTMVAGLANADAGRLAPSQPEDRGGTSRPSSDTGTEEATYQANRLLRCRFDPQIERYFQLKWQSLRGPRAGRGTNRWCKIRT